jgi:hypothetical protein
MTYPLRGGRPIGGWALGADLQQCHDGTPYVEEEGGLSIGMSGFHTLSGQRHCAGPLGYEIEIPEELT